MAYTSQYAWIIPWVPLPVPVAIEIGLLIVPTTAKSLRRIWVFPSILLLNIIMIFSADLSIQQMNGSFIYQYIPAPLGITEPRIRPEYPFIQICKNHPHSEWNSGYPPRLTVKKNRENK